MNEFLSIAVGTITMRPYVFAFFAAYLCAAVPHLGWKKVGIFTVLGYAIAFASEYSSINNGFPYGWYYYIDTTRDRELWIAGVPFFDSLSYVFLTYCSYTTALFIVSPLRGWKGGVITLETRAIRRSFAVLFLGALLQVFLDIIIDPVALQGSRWFLGQIYGYRTAGIHYGVPLSNYLGWFGVSFLLVLALQVIDRRVQRDVEQRPKGVRDIPFRSLMGPFLYLSVLIFNLTITMLIGERQMALTGFFTFCLPVAIVVTLALRRVNRYSKEELAEHLRDFPFSPVGRTQR